MAEFRTGQIINDADAATTFLTTLSSACVAAGWEAIPPVVDGNSSVYTNWAWRVPAAVSGYTDDFYVVIMQNGQSIYLLAAEAASATAGKYVRFTGHTGSAAALADTSYGSAIGVSLWPTQAIASTTHVAAANTTNMTYYIGVTRRALFYRIGTATADLFHAGLFESAQTYGPNEFPLVKGKLDSGVTNSMQTSRRPGASATSYYYWNCMAYNDLLMGGTQLPTIGVGEPYGGVLGARASMRHNYPTYSGAPTGFGQFRGMLYDCLVFQQSSINVGDTLTLDTGERYVYLGGALGGSQYGLWFNKDAA